MKIAAKKLSREKGYIERKIYMCEYYNKSTPVKYYFAPIILSNNYILTFSGIMASPAGPPGDSGLDKKRWDLNLDVMAMLDKTDTETNSDTDSNSDTIDQEARGNEDGGGATEPGKQLAVPMDTEDGTGASGAGATPPLNTASNSRTEGADFNPPKRIVRPLLDEAEFESPMASATPAVRFVSPSSNNYKIIRDQRIKSYVAPGLYGSPSDSQVNESFYNDMENSSAKVRVTSTLHNKRNISTTFDPERFICRTCSSSHIVGLKSGQNVPAFIVTDQCFPALSAPEGEGGCMAIVRMEDATLRELADLLVETVKGRRLPRGTIVVISAGGHLARVGVAAYAWDLLEAIKILKTNLPPASFVAHGPMVFNRGVGDMATIRAVSDICMWQAQLAKDGAIGDYLPMANMAAIRLLERRGTAGNQPLYPIRLSMPASMASNVAKIWHSAGSTELPLATIPLEEDDEPELMYYLATELNRKVGAGLGTQLTTGQHTTRNVLDTMVIVGNDHAQKLAVAAQNSGRKVTLIKVPSNEEGEVRFAARSLREAIANIPEPRRINSMVLYALLDDKCYMVKTREGALIPIRPAKKMIQHVAGTLVIAPPDLVRDVVASIGPLLKASEGVQSLLLCPIPRNINGPCCSASDHMPGYTVDGHRGRLLQQLDTIRKAAKQACRSLHVNLKVANVGKTVIKSSGGWVDQTTPKPEIYQEIVDKSLIEVLDRREESSTSSASKRKLPDTWQHSIGKRANSNYNTNSSGGTASGYHDVSYGNRSTAPGGAWSSRGRGGRAGGHHGEYRGGGHRGQ